MHAVHIPWLAMPNYINTGEISIDKKGIKNKIEKMITKLTKEGKVNVSVSVKKVAAADAILNVAKSQKAHMIIIGAHSKAKSAKGSIS